MYVIRIKKNSPTFQVKAKKTDVRVLSVGKRGIQGITGPQGETGPAGQGIASGGASGQYLRKASSTDYDTQWHSPTSDEISDTAQTNKFVTAAQKSLIDSSVQPGDNVSVLTNDAGYLTDLNAFTTDDLTEGSRLYFTNARADARISAQAGVADGLATLGSDGKIPTSQLPALAITDTFVVASQAAMLALTAEVGDIAVRTDLNKSYILKTAGASTLANWQELLTPTDTVLSVNGQTGAVTLTTSNISEGSNLYYTDERVDDRVATLIQNGTGISWTYSDAGGTLTPAVSLASFSTSNLSEGSNLYYTDERVDDRVSSLLVAGAGISLTYDDSGNTLTIANELTAAPSSDLTASGPKVTLTAGENLVFGDIGYLKSDGKVWKGDADDVAKAPALFFALGTINTDASGSFALPGNFIRNDGWSWTVGGLIYLSQTAGGMTQTAPTATDTVTQIIGIGTHADRMLFYPSIDYITHI